MSLAVTVVYSAALIDRKGARSAVVAFAYFSLACFSSNPHSRFHVCSVYEFMHILLADIPMMMRGEIVRDAELQYKSLPALCPLDTNRRLAAPEGRLSHEI
jgi:hypothetical protein